MTRRITKLAAVYLLLGLVATWAVAWGLALLGPPRSGYRLIDIGDDRTLNLIESRCFGGRAFEFFGSEPLIVEVEGEEVPSERDSRPPAVADIIWGRVHTESRTALVAAEARGWPRIAFRCLVYGQSFRATSSQSGEQEHSGGLVSTGKPFESRYAVRLNAGVRRANLHVRSTLLPYSPYWPGLLADTLFYAMLFAGLHQLAGWGRRTRRRRRGCCAACGYDLTGIDGVCPECGAGR